nr:hypothetical protein [Tanacetum cinerariifolium]
VDEFKAERLAKTQDPLTLMANSNNPYAFLEPHQDQSSFNQNYLQQPMPNPKDIIDPTTAMNIALALMAKAFKLNYSTPTNNNQRISSNPRNRQIAQPEWSRHVTIVHQTKDLHTADYTQLYDFLKYNQKEYYMQQPMPNPEDITDSTTAMNMSLALMAKAFKLNYSTPTNNNQRISSNPKNRQIAQPGMNMGQDRQIHMIGGNGGNQFRQVQNVGNQNGLMGVQGNGNLVAVRAEGNAAGHNENQIRCYNCRGVGHFARDCTARPRRRDAAYLQTQLLIAQKEEAGIQHQAEEYDLMAAAADLDEIEEVNANCILMANL